MAFDFSSLEPHITAILSAPGTDLATISAKRVRRQLQDIEPVLTAEFLKENKQAIDAVIASVFEKVQGETQLLEESQPEQSTDHNGYRKRKQEDDEEEVEEEADDDEVDAPVPKKPKKAAKSGRELSDAELARKLSSEINSRSRRSTTTTRKSASPKKAGKSKKKSAETIEDSEDDGSAPPKKAKGGFGKEYLLSEPLADLLQVDKLSRPQVVKSLWDYIKGNDLQNPSNKREIMCDEKLRAVFSVDKIDMFKMNKVLGQHLHEPDS